MPPVTVRYALGVLVGGVCGVLLRSRYVQPEPIQTPLTQARPRLAHRMAGADKATMTIHTSFLLLVLSDGAEAGPAAPTCSDASWLEPRHCASDVAVMPVKCKHGYSEVPCVQLLLLIFNFSIVKIHRSKSLFRTSHCGTVQ